jgi:hypothetical protein
MPPMPGQCLLYKKIIPKVLLKAKSFFDHDGNQGARISRYVHLISPNRAILCACVRSLCACRDFRIKRRTAFLFRPFFDRETRTATCRATHGAI